MNNILLTFLTSQKKTEVALIILLWGCYWLLDIIVFSDIPIESRPFSIIENYISYLFGLMLLLQFFR